MKKRFILAGILLTMCMGLTACGNPLKQLPEATEENIYNEDEETTGNEAADEIIDVLTDEDEGGIDGDVVSFMVYDREDNEDSKKKSDVYVEIVIETDEYEFTGYFIVEMKYDDEDGWEVKDFEEDDDEDSIVKPLEGADEETVWDTIYYSLDSFYVGDEYFYIGSSNMGDVEILNSEITEDDGTFYNEMTVQFEFLEYDCIYLMEYELVFEYYYGSWSLDDYEYPQRYEIVEY